MKTAIAISSLFLSLAFVSCGDTDSHEKAMGDLVDFAEEIADIAVDASDEASAVQAAEKIAAKTDELKEIASRFEVLGKPDDATRKELTQEFKKPLEVARDEIVAALEGLEEHPNAAEEIMVAMGELLALMSSQSVK
ncbi:MAG: hypothetical protein ACI8UO_000520 [Verrucomicrobiales bacterium]|jgi:hypothetical protein